MRTFHAVVALAKQYFRKLDAMAKV
jgi:hypothetical protein